MPRSRYAIAKDIVIPAGTEVGMAPSRTDYISRHAEAIIEVTKDTTAHWRMDLSDALETGLIKEI